MNYKVFLAEDEIVVREGIRDRVPWKETEFVFCGEAPDGEMAIPLIEEIRPDILITDIKMPFMDGLELSRYIKKTMPQIKIIIISGHHDFYYAKQAISIGVEEYVLKPINSNDLLNALFKVAKLIDQDKLHNEFINTTNSYKRENAELHKEKVLNEILMETVPPYQVAGLLATLDLDLYAKKYGLISIRYQVDSSWNSHTSALLQEAIEKSILGRPDVIKVNRSFREVVLIVKGDTTEQVEDDYKILKLLLNKHLAKIESGKYSIEFGKIQSRLHEISRSYREIIQHDISEIAIHQYEEILGEEIRNMTCDQSHYIKFNDIEILEALKCESEEVVLRIIRNYFDKIKDIPISPVWSIYLAIRINLIYGTFLAEMGNDDQDIIPKSSIIEETALELDSIEKLQIYMEEICLCALELRTSSKKRNHVELVESAKNYIHSNYSDPNISLRRVASQIYISDCHLSTIFSRETGTTFIQYLTNVRIKKAKELLKMTNIKAGKVGLSVGYKDPHYFSYIFKKNVGCNPSQYMKLYT